MPIAAQSIDFSKQVARLSRRHVSDE
jgi:hypothetical protein